MSLNIDFTQMEAPQERSRGVLAEGWYTARIEKSEPKENSAKTGGYLEMTYDMMDPGVQGRKVFELYNVWNPNPMAQKIAMEDLKRISMATGVMRIQSVNAQEFVGIPLKIRLEIEKGTPKPDGSGNYPDKNRIAQYAHIQDPAAQAPPPQQNAAPQGGAPAGGGFGPPATPWGSPPAGQQPQQAPAQAQGGAPWAGGQQQPQQPQQAPAQGFPGGGAAPAQPWEQPQAQAQAQPQQAAAPAQAANQQAAPWQAPQQQAQPQAASVGPAGGPPPWAR